LPSLHRPAKKTIVDGGVKMHYFQHNGPPPVVLNEGKRENPKPVVPGPSLLFPMRDTHEFRSEPLKGFEAVSLQPDNSNTALPAF
jgi:hypothetical protein